METKQTEAAASTATTPEMLHKDSVFLQTIKALKPKFDTLTATDIIKHVSGLTTKVEPTAHGEILDELLKNIEPVDFEKAAFPQVEELRAKCLELQSQLTNPDGSYKKNAIIEGELKEIQKQLYGFKLTQKHFAILSIENVLMVAEKMKWGICKNNYFIYLYNGEYWANIEKEAFQSFLGKAAELMGVARFTSRWYDFRDTLFKQFIATSYLPKPKTIKNRVLINLKNGTFEITPTGHKLRKFDRADFLTYQLPFSYDSNATAPLFDRYLGQVQPDPLRQLILAEYLGCVFVPASYLKLEKALILYGSGANGKSVFFDIVNALFGDENVSGYSLESLTDKDGYYRAMIQNKLLNYTSELNANQATTDKTKQLISGEKIQARLPYGLPFDITNYAKFIFNCNELPKNAEQTEAYFRRFLIVNFEQTIPEHEQDKQLSKKIIESELSGVFNWVLLGLNRLLKQKGFTYCKAVNEARKQYELESDSVNQFVEDSGYLASATVYSPIVELYREYRTFCIEDGCQAVKKGNFIKRLKHLKITVDRLNVGNIAYLTKQNAPY
ncbi:MAG: phage/plasmid primase, P4 family [Paludibacter sp.]|nr:phage/plasmid primase, P4 family [Paludibacter sp.]